jgi:hypothetical protein
MIYNEGTLEQARPEMRRRYQLLPSQDPVAYAASEARCRPRQRKRMMVILAKWKGSGLYFNPVSDDNEVHEFANELDSVFKNAGWQTAWAPLIILATGGGRALTRTGIAISFRNKATR